MEEMTLAEATKFFAEFYGGEHHIPKYQSPKRCGLGWYIDHDRGELATFDYGNLTKLVLMGHDHCMRVSVRPKSKTILQICIFKRLGREGSIMERHPTIETAIETFKNNNRVNV